MNTTQERTQTTYQKLIGRIDNEYYFLDYVFETDAYKGAVASVLSPVSFEEMEYRRENFDEDGELWKDAVANDRTELGHKEWAAHVLRLDGDDAVIDLSYFSTYGEELLQRLDPEHEVYEYTEGVGGGRSFRPDMKWDELYEPELWQIIQQYETS